MSGASGVTGVTGASGRRGRARRVARRAGIGLVVAALALTAGSIAVNAATDTPAALPSGLRFVQAGDVRTRVETWGASGPAVVLVHGAAEQATTWAPVAERLAADHRVVAFDLDGWGYTDRVAPFDLDHQTRQLLAVLDALRLARPVLVGHSSGAAPVVEAALRAPDRLGGIMLLDGDALDTGAGQAGPGRALILPPYRTTVLRLALRSDRLVRGVYAAQCGPRCPELDAAGLDAWRRPFAVPGAESGLWTMAAQGVVGMSAERVAGVAARHVPAAVVFGAEDDVFPTGTPEQTAARVGAPAPTLIPGGRHLTMISDPGPVAEAVRALVRRAASDPPRG